MTTPGAAVMMYTVDALAHADLRGTLQKIADLGYLGVETYGLYGLPAREFRNALDDAGLELISSHAPFPYGEHATKILDEYAELGAPNLAWSMEAEEFATPEAITAGLERVNGGVENAKAYGMTVAYHNHNAEFANYFDGRSAYDLLLEQLHPDARVELDLYWTAVGKADPAAIIRGIGPRLRYLHVKDGPALTYGQDTLVPIGQGSIDMLSALTASPSVEWNIVELEKLDIDPYAALAQSYTFLTENELARGNR